MKSISFMTILVSFLLLSSCKGTSASGFEDPVKVDPKHYKVEFENDEIRLLHVTYGPHEKSPLHNHPENVVIELTESNVRETKEDGRSADSRTSRGVGGGPAIRHALENLDDMPFENFIIELKKKR